jgi:ABC-type transport system involved in multi-copper enzyme maturation permease subunit
MKFNSLVESGIKEFDDNINKSLKVTNNIMLLTFSLSAVFMFASTWIMHSIQAACIAVLSYTSFIIAILFIVNTLIVMIALNTHIMKEEFEKLKEKPETN